MRACFRSPSMKVGGHRARLTGSRQTGLSDYGAGLSGSRSVGSEEFTQCVAGLTGSKQIGVQIVGATKEHSTSSPGTAGMTGSGGSRSVGRSIVAT
eukprot:2693070-Rhodomonas_salina.1